MIAYYNENDTRAASWLRELINAGHIADGIVDERSIEDVLPDEIKEFTQCHFFAGIGVWSYALRQTGWPDDKHVWTGSCPCQPFSAAGKAKGFIDERHLWPAWHHLIDQCRPGVVFGEQVASKDGLGWFDLVQTDLEGTGYTCGAIDLCAAGVGAPHIRQRLWFVAERMGNSQSSRLERRIVTERELQEKPRRLLSSRSSNYVYERLADTEYNRYDRAQTHAPKQGGNGSENWVSVGSGNRLRRSRTDPTNGFWRNADWLYCRDGKWRAVEPGTFPLVDGAPARVGRLRGYGNALNTEVARVFIESYKEYCLDFSWMDG